LKEREEKGRKGKERELEGKGNGRKGKRTRMKGKEWEGLYLFIVLPVLHMCLC